MDAFSAAADRWYSFSHVVLMKEGGAQPTPRTGDLLQEFWPTQEQQQQQQQKAAGSADGGAKKGSGQKGKGGKEAGGAAEEEVCWKGFLKVSRKDFLSASEFHFGPTFVVLTSERLLHHKVGRSFR